MPRSLYSQGLFGTLPSDILHKIFLELNLQGPGLKIIEHQATATQLAEVLALDAYHLIIDLDANGHQIYSLGFCKKSASGGAEYVKAPLDIK